MISLVMEEISGGVRMDATETALQNREFSPIIPEC